MTKAKLTPAQKALQNFRDAYSQNEPLANWARGMLERGTLEVNTPLGPDHWNGMSNRFKPQHTLGYAMLMSDQEDLRKLALESGVNIDHPVPGMPDCSPLFHAAQDLDTELMLWLLHHGASPHMRSNSGETLWHALFRPGKLEDSISDHDVNESNILEIARLCRKAGAPAPSVPDHDGFTPLYGLVEAMGEMAAVSPEDLNFDNMVALEVAYQKLKVLTSLTPSPVFPPDDPNLREMLADIARAEQPHCELYGVLCEDSGSATQEEATAEIREMLRNEVSYQAEEGISLSPDNLQMSNEDIKDFTQTEIRRYLRIQLRLAQYLITHGVDSRNIEIPPLLDELNDETVPVFETLIYALRNRVRNEMKKPGAASSATLLNADGNPSTLLLTAASTGVLDVVFNPNLWQGRETEAQKIWNTLPDYYQQQYASVLDSSLLRNAARNPSDNCLSMRIAASRRRSDNQERT